MRPLSQRNAETSQEGAVQLVIDTAGVVRDVDVNVQVPDATVADLLEALGHPAADGAGGISVEGRFLRSYLTLAEAGLHDGVLVRLAASPLSRSAL